MGRGKVQLKRIENKISRQVTFSKRRTGLLKKAHEISVLCDAEVALIVFSTKGKLFEYSTDSSMEGILERYEQYSYAERQSMGIPNSESQESWSMEYPKLAARIEILQRKIRNYTGENLDPLSLRELQSLEQQIDTALKRVRTRKNQVMHESISEMQKKHKTLQEQNNSLTKKLKENGKVLQAEPNIKQPNTSTLMLLPPLQPPSQPSPPTLLSSLTIGGAVQGRRQAMDEDGEDHQGRAQTRPTTNTMMPPWMVRHLN
ncbi:hypothetical protein M0R45_033198 [Rubus argutus]|uniref:Uncharacterized protein n=1 Tax=Rubus argutus TaxID=59490 RepID=A0AAW1WLH3_RUBAR